MSARDGQAARCGGAARGGLRRAHQAHFRPPQLPGLRQGVQRVHLAAAEGEVCPKTNEPHRLFQRSDDNETAVAERLRVYDEKTKPLIEYYSAQELLRSIQASGEVDEITNRLNAVCCMCRPRRRAAPARRAPARHRRRSAHRPAGLASTARGSRRRVIKKKAKAEAPKKGAARKVARKAAAKKKAAPRKAPAKKSTARRPVAKKSAKRSKAAKRVVAEACPSEEESKESAALVEGLATAKCWPCHARRGARRS